MNELQGKFGMFEMELAASVIKAKHAPVTLEDFNMEQQRIGFLHLLCHGWMEPHIYNGVFVGNKEFWEKVK